MSASTYSALRTRSESSNGRSVHDWISLWVLRLVKARRLKYAGENDREFYTEFFTDDDAVKCERDLRRVLRDEEVRRALRSLREGSIVVDVGCGLAGPLAGLPASYLRIGLDYSHRSLRYVKTSAASELTLVTGSITALPFEDNSIDAIVCLEVLEHIEDDRCAIGEIARVLKKDGMLVASVPAAFYFPEYLTLMGHWRHYSAESFRRALGTSGLAVKADLCTYPRLNRASFYICCILWALNYLSTPFTKQRGTLYEMKLPLFRATAYQQVEPLLRRIAKRDVATACRAGTFVQAVKE